MIELNADIGEGHDDDALMPYLARASIACGGHCGDAASMRAALRRCAEHGVAAGAHPSYPDRAGFGRRRLAGSPDEVARWVAEQTETLAEAAAKLGLALAHVKPHGALYNDAADDAALARAVVEGVVRVDRRLAVVGLSGSHLVSAARAAGLAALNEAFVDRRYQTSGRLVSRETPGAVIGEPDAAAAQALALAVGAPLAAEGGTVRITAETLCVHSDTANALNIARAVHRALHRA